MNPTSPQKHVWRARIVLLSGDGVGTAGRRLKHGVFHSLVDPQAAINRFVAQHNAGHTKPFVCRADPDTIIAAGNRGFETSESIH